MVVFFIIVMMFLTYMWIEAHRNTVRIEELSFHSLPKSFHQYKIFFISDVHRRLISKRIIDKWRGDVDLVVIGGDLCERGVTKERIEENVKRLTSLAKKTVFVWGNNDVEVSEEMLRSLFQKYDVIELNNSVHQIVRDEDVLFIAGVDRSERVKDIVHKGDHPFSILVCHYPEVIDNLPRNHPFSLILSGHTHGGQIRFFHWGLREKGKLHKVNDVVHLISNGYGTTLIPLRLGAPAEAHVLILKSEE